MKKFIVLIVLSWILTSCNTQHHTAGTRMAAKPLPGKGSAAETPVEPVSALKFYQKKYSPLLGSSSSEIRNLALYKFIDEWIRVPYKYGGESKTGVDCSGLSALLEKEVYGKSISGGSAAIFPLAKKISEDDLREGDLVFFKINSEAISHMGVYLVNNKFIHASSKAGVIISDLNDPYYTKYFYAAGRLK